jgi:hypothetical protein
MLAAAGISLVLLLNLVGLLLIPLGLPGIWLQVMAALALAAATGGERIGWAWVGVCAGLALAGELAEFASGQWGARRFGGSRRAAWGALLGGLTGAMIGGIPLPIVGSVVASFIGTFLGALAGELSQPERGASGLRVGMGALVGRVLGTAAKLFCAVVIFVVSAVRLLLP